MGQPDKVLGAPGVKIEPVWVVDKHVNRSAIVLHELHKLRPCRRHGNKTTLAHR
jgi:hypothetical protein